MNADIFAEWLRRRGHHVVRTASSYWHSQGPRVYQAFPYHWIINIPNEELRQVLSLAKAIGLRYSAPAEMDYGKISYHAIYDQEHYDIDSLSKWSRKNVRRGLRSCRIAPITFERLAEEGWELQTDTLDRQHRNPDLSREAWNHLCWAAHDLPGFEAWGAIVDGCLAASVITFQMDDWGYMLYQQCRRDFLPLHVNNALSFEVSRTVMARPQVQAVLYGLHSLDAPPSMDEFKFRMGYRARPVRQRVVFHPWLRPFFNRASHAALRLVAQARPGNPILAKAEGMVRFYLEGQRPLHQQTWPACLTSNQTNPREA